MIIKFARVLLKNGFIRTRAERFYEQLKRATASVETSVPEVTPLGCRASNRSGFRLNLLVPALSVRHVFGGIATAVDIFQQMTEKEANVRILLTDEGGFDHNDNPAFSGWNIGCLEDDDRDGRWIIPMGNRYGKTLSVANGDRFVATAWWTAACALSIRKWQALTYFLPSFHRFLYLIQDYEPGFYPWSSRYALAEATYLENEGLIALFNTSLLQSFFAEQGFKFDHQFAFEPRINRRLAQYLDEVDLSAKENRILVYGRPGVSRNAFELLVMGLREWVRRFPSAGSWAIISVGEEHEDVELGGGVIVRSLGKLTLEEYAKELLRSSIGLSLMVSPHPSYPPLEMAAFGLNVITNGYAVKDLSRVHRNIVSLDILSPEKIATALVDLTSSSVDRPAASPASGESWFRQYAAGRVDGGYEMLEPIVGLLRS